MAVIDIRIDVALINSPKLAILESEIGDGAIAWLVRLWCLARMSAGNLGPTNSSHIERTLRWSGTPGALWTALEAGGWIDHAESGWVVHGWEEHQPFATAQETGRLGGIRSGEVRRKKAEGRRNRPLHNEGPSKGPSKGPSNHPKSKDPSEPLPPSDPPPEGRRRVEVGGNCGAPQTPASAAPPGGYAVGGESAGAEVGNGDTAANQPDRPPVDLSDVSPELRAIAELDPLTEGIAALANHIRRRNREPTPDDDEIDRRKAASLRVLRGGTGGTD